MFCLLQVREEELKATYEALNLSLPCAPTSAQQEVESDAGLPEPGEKLTSFNWNSAESEADESKDELEETEDVSTHELADSSSKESPPWVDELEEEETDVSTHELADSSSKESFPSEDELEEEETDVSPGLATTTARSLFLRRTSQRWKKFTPPITGLATKTARSLRTPPLPALLAEL